MANRLYVLASHWLGLVLPFHGTWRLLAVHPGLAAGDVSARLEAALAVAGLDQATVVHRPRLLSDNGPSYVSAELASWLTA